LAKSKLQGRASFREEESGPTNMVCGCNLENKNVLVPSHISEYNFNVNSKDKIES
jgi:hypothetical protein